MSRSFTSPIVTTAPRWPLAGRRADGRSACEPQADGDEASPIVGRTRPLVELDFGSGRDGAVLGRRVVLIERDKETIVGLFKRQPKEPVESGSEDFFEDSVLGVAAMVEAKTTHRVVPEMSAGAGNPYVRFKVLVKLQDTEPYEAEFTQPVEVAWMLELKKDTAKPFAVRVSKADRHKVRIAFDVDPRTVSVGKGSAAELLATGTPARAIIIENEELRPAKQDKKGNPMYRFLLTVMRDGADPYRANVGNGVPPSALPFLFPGSNVPVKVNPDVRQQVVIDWAAATDEAAAKQA
jgi:hypothetical protein